MYHEVTYEDLRERRGRCVRVVVAVALACLAAFGAYRYSRAVSHEQGAAAVRQAVINSALQCCAVEGSYPTSVSHLVDHYGLVINSEDYRVSYEWLGDNIPPSVVVKTP